MVIICRITVAVIYAWQRRHSCHSGAAVAAERATIVTAGRATVAAVATVKKTATVAVVL